MNPLLKKLVTLLHSHVGRDNIISARDLAREMDLPRKNGDRTIRDILSEALATGTLEELEIPLCAIPGRGYFLASDIEEAQAYADWCHALATEAARKSASVRKLFRGLGLNLQPSKK